MEVTEPAPARARIEEQLRSLPLLPVVVTKMLTLNRDAEDYFEEITQLAGQDPTFAVRLIRIANSSALAARSQITSLRSAIVRLGTAQIAALVTSIAVSRIFVPNSREARDLWLHSIQVALAARSLAVMGEKLDIAPDDAYLAGLLHDIGRFLLIDSRVDELTELVEYGWESPRMLLDRERTLCGFDHAQLGWRICSTWGLPPSIVSLVRAHHAADLEGASGHNRRLRNMVRITRLADGLSMAAMDRTGNRGSSTDTAQRIGEWCAPLVARDPFVSLAELQALAPGVLAEAERQFAMLGLPSY